MMHRKQEFVGLTCRLFPHFNSFFLKYFYENSEFLPTKTGPMMVTPRCKQRLKYYRIAPLFSNLNWFKLQESIVSSNYTFTIAEKQNPEI